MKNKKEEVIYSDTSSAMQRIKEENERYENSTPEFKILKDVFNLLSRACYNIKYKGGSKEEALLELAEARGMLNALLHKELAKTIKGE